MTCQATHYNACDCREEYFKQLEAENRVLREALEEARSELCSEHCGIVDEHEEGCIKISKALSQSLTTRLAEIERAKNDVVEEADIYIKRTRGLTAKCDIDLIDALARLADLERTK